MAIYHLLFFLEFAELAKGLRLHLIKILTCSTPQNDYQNISFVNDKHKYGEKMARKGHTKVIYKAAFISKRSLIGSQKDLKTSI